MLIIRSASSRSESEAAKPMSTTKFKSPDESESYPMLAGAVTWNWCGVIILTGAPLSKTASGGGGVLLSWWGASRYPLAVRWPKVALGVGRFEKFGDQDIWKAKINLINDFFSKLGLGFVWYAFFLAKFDMHA